MCAVMCILVMACLAGGNISGLWNVRASGLTNDLIKEKEEEIQSAKDLKKELQSNLTDVKKVKEELEESKKDLAEYVERLDGELATVQAKIADLKGKIETKETEILQTQEELEAAIEDQENQYAAMKKRIKFMYEKGDNLYMELIFSSESFSEMLNKAEYIEMLSAYDRKMLDKYVETRELIELYKEQLEEEHAYLEEAKAGVESEEASLNSLIDEKKETIEKVSDDIEEKEAAIAEYEAYIKEQNETIAILEKVVAEEKAKLAEESRIKYDGGMFKWPAPSYTKITSEFGNRMHPTLGVEKFHNGIDMAAPGGSPILAAYDGNVVAADYSNSMGNYIMIDHGDGLYTIYMHASALYVSKGSFVTKGQNIAAVGTTGRSTGNHLHFSVRLNGSYVNPRSYLGS
ncbi:MAG: peptidoglycan DD-metalloendopeptidase family protein [Kineothrix sp.]|nr:peptidoglycan DD-metalloendopeptidase family protein [Kineothrix sp.]NBI89401.1 peptidase M23 [Lachnospiraceae bacterium]